VPMSGARLVQLGLSYKPGVSDTRNSPAVRLLEGLICEGAVVRAFDPLVEAQPSTGCVPGDADLEWADAVLLAVNHPGWEIRHLVASSTLIDVTGSLPSNACSEQL